jgi:hypothetical protein
MMEVLLVLECNCFLVLTHLQMAGIKTKIAPTVKNLNMALLKFVQGTGISEKWMHEPHIDGKQVRDKFEMYSDGILIHAMDCLEQKFKVVYKDIFQMVKSILKDPKFVNNLHFEGKVERQVQWCMFLDCVNFIDF